MNNDEKLMMTVVLTTLILTVGLGLTAFYCVNHVNDGAEDAELPEYVFNGLENHGGYVYYSGGYVAIYPSDYLTQTDGTLMVERGGNVICVVISNIVYVQI